MTTHEFTIKEKEIVAFKKRRYVRNMLNAAIAKGEIFRPKCCQMCHREKKVQGHHTDYGKPLHVHWLCNKCHSEAHKPGHELNPDNVAQTPLPQCLDEKQMVTITFSFPIKNFLAVQKEAEEKNIPISVLLREKNMTIFPVQDNQLAFNFEKVNNDSSSEELDTRVQCVAENQEFMLQRKTCIIRKVRSKRSPSVPRVARRLPQVSKRYGSHASELHRAVSS